MALDGFEDDHIVSAAKSFIRGSVTGQSLTFAPSVAEFTKQVEYYWKLAGNGPVFMSQKTWDEIYRPKAPALPAPVRQPTIARQPTPEELASKERSRIAYANYLKSSEPDSDMVQVGDLIKMNDDQLKVHMAKLTEAHDKPVSNELLEWMDEKKKRNAIDNS